MTYKNIIFDLDGTLIDSAAAIVKSLSHAFDASQIKPVCSLDRSLVGPPLREIIKKVVSENEAIYLDQVEQLFIRHYDSGGFAESQVFPGVDMLLRSLLDHGCVLHIATNKRESPTRAITELFGWQYIFKNVYSLDTFTPAIKDKSGLIARLLLDEKIEMASACYVGDRIEDALAAKNNGLDFFMASWGYDVFHHDYHSLSKPIDLLNFLNKH